MQWYTQALIHKTKQNRLLRKGLNDGHRAILEPMVLRNKKNIRNPVLPDKLKRTPKHRLPPQLNEVISLLEPYRSRFNYHSKPNKEELQVLAWILESYLEAYDSLRKSSYWEPNLVIKNLPLALASHWGEVLRWIEDEENVERVDVDSIDLLQKYFVL